MKANPEKIIDAIVFVILALLLVFGHDEWAIFSIVFILLIFGGNEWLSEKTRQLRLDNDLKEDFLKKKIEPDWSSKTSMD